MHSSMKRRRLNPRHHMDNLPMAIICGPLQDFVPGLPNILSMTDKYHRAVYHQSLRLPREPWSKVYGSSLALLEWMETPITSTLCGFLINNGNIDVLMRCVETQPLITIVPGQMDVLSRCAATHDWISAMIGHLPGAHPFKKIYLCWVSMEREPLVEMVALKGIYALKVLFAIRCILQKTDIHLMFPIEYCVGIAFDADQRRPTGERYLEGWMIQCFGTRPIDPTSDSGDETELEDMYPLPDSGDETELEDGVVAR